MNWTRTIGLALALRFVGTPTQAQEADHLESYKIVDALKLTGTVDLEILQLGLVPGCRISTAKLFSVPATARNAAATQRCMPSSRQVSGEPTCGEIAAGPPLTIVPSSS